MYGTVLPSCLEDGCGTDGERSRDFFGSNEERREMGEGERGVGYQRDPGLRIDDYFLFTKFVGGDVYLYFGE